MLVREDIDAQGAFDQIQDHKTRNKHADRKEPERQDHHAGLDGVTASLAAVQEDLLNVRAPVASQQDDKVVPRPVQRQLGTRIHQMARTALLAAQRLVEGFHLCRRKRSAHVLWNAVDHIVFVRVVDRVIHGQQAPDVIARPPLKGPSYPRFGPVALWA